MKTFALKGISKILSSKSNPKTIAFAIIIFFALSAIVPAALGSSVTTAVPDRPTGTFVGLSPNLVGLGQSVVVNIITYPAPRTPSFWVQNLVGVYPSGFRNISVTITKPDGTKSTSMPIDETLSALGVNVPGAAEIVGSLQYTFVPDQVGNYSFTASFPGQTYTNDGITTVLNQTVHYLPSSSAVSTLTVQKDPILAGILNGYPWSPLPTSYWSEPVSTNNREWSAISGDWVTSGYDIMGTKYNQYSTAPSTAHILWTKTVGLGGLAGGAWGSAPYAGQGAPMGGAGGIVLDGKIYQASSVTTGYYDTVDLRTGQTLWTALGAPSRAQRLYLPFQTSAQVQEGGISTYLWDFKTGYWLRYNPYNGETLQNITGVPTDITAPSFDDGNPVTFVIQRGGFNTTIPLNFAYENLIKWNFTQLTSYTGASTGNTAGSSNSWSRGVVWNVSIRQPDGTDVGFSAVGGNAAISANYWPAANMVTVRGALPFMGFDATTGKYLWYMQTVETMNGGGSGGPTGPETYGPQMVFDGSDSSWVAYDITTGKEMWSTEVGQLPWSDLPSFVNLFHNGTFYAGSYDGHVYALDLKTGHIKWTSDYVGKQDESIYGNQPYNGGAVGADGKLYFSTSTTYSLIPRTRFHELICIDENTGHFLWNITIGATPRAVADGILLATDTENGIQYAFGQGQTTTTVSASDSVTSGTPMTIQGSVMDMSVGKPNTPAISDSDMSVWMDYLYGQNATLINSPPTPQGVAVQLNAVDPNGNAIDLGIVTSDSSGHFAKSWTPTTAGLYTIYATFAGSNSYYSSYAETSTSVAVSSPSATQQPIQATQVDNTMTIVIGFALVIIAIAIVGILLLRKK